MSRLGLRIVAWAAAAIAIGAATSAPAEAHGRSRIFFGFNYNCCWGPPAYYPAYSYYPPPVYYAPPPVAYVAPPPVYYAPPRPAAPYCRDYRGDATIDGQGTPFYGRACLQADGRWHIVN